MNTRPEPLSLQPQSAENLLAEISAGAARRDLERTLPFAEVDALKTQRFGALRLPQAHGGAGLSWSDALPQILELGAADSNIAHIWRNHFMLAERLAVMDGQHPIQPVLRQAVADGALFGLAGAEAVRCRIGGNEPGTPLRPDSEGYRITARKVYSTGSIFADHIVTYAELPDGTRVNVILPKNRAGIETVDDWDGMGQRLTGTGTTLFHDVWIAPEEVILPSELHPQIATFSSTIAQVVLTTVIAGIVAAIARDAKTVLGARESSFYFAPSERVQDDPLLLAALGERAAEAFAVEAIVLALGPALDGAASAIAAGRDARVEVERAALAAAKAKIVVDQLAQRAGAALYDVAGASATRRGLNLDRHWRNLRTIASHNPASYKAMAVGAHMLNGTQIPTMGFF